MKFVVQDYGGVFVPMVVQERSQRVCGNDKLPAVCEDTGSIQEDPQDSPLRDEHTGEEDRL